MGSNGPGLLTADDVSAPERDKDNDAPLHVRVLDEEWTARWDDFVQSHPDATFFHRSEWRGILEDVFRHRCHYLLAETNQGVEGILPLAHVKSRLFGSALISTPFAVYGGVVATTERARVELEQSATVLANSLGVDYLELRDQKPSASTSTDGFSVKDLYFTFRKTIDPDPEKNLKAIPRKQRAVVRKTLKAGLETALDDDVELFFRAYSESVRNLGTPVFAKQYFSRVKRAFGEDCEILVVMKDGRLVSSVMSFYFRDQVLPYYGGGTEEARALKANDFMYWELMSRVCQRGIRIFDYGRSKVGTGSYDFKRHWGFEPEPLPYRYRLIRAKETPNVSPANPKYRLFISAWKKLPLPVANRIGPFISRSLG
jgi:FemAB-related protein (PEP-CTERM system-associated)